MATIISSNGTLLYFTVKCMERNPGLTIPRYNDVISPGPRYIFISRSTALPSTMFERIKTSNIFGDM